MKTAKLFGVRFAKDPAWKDNVLQHFITGKIQKEKEARRLENAQLKAIERHFNISADELRQKLDSKSHAFDFSEITNFLKEEASCRHYYITAPVLEMSQKIRVKPPYDVEWLAPVPDGKRQLNFANHFFRYEKNGDRIVAMAATLSATPKTSEYLNYSFFNMDLGTKHISASQILDDYDATPSHAIPFQDFESNSRKLFFQLVTFMELSKIQEVWLPPGRKHGSKKSPDHTLNDAEFPITIVNTNWNKIIRREGFQVDGHLRKQHYGPGNVKRRLIWIDDYHKEGYNLGAARERHQKRKGLGP